MLQKKRIIHYIITNTFKQVYSSCFVCITSSGGSSHIFEVLEIFTNWMLERERKNIVTKQESSRDILSFLYGENLIIKNLWMQLSQFQRFIIYTYVT